MRSGRVKPAVEWGEKPREWVTVMPSGMAESDTPWIAYRFLPSPEADCLWHSCGRFRMGVYFLQKVRNMGEKEKLTLHEISDQEWQVLQHLRQLQYGELLVSVKDGRPIRVEEIRKSIQIK